MTVILTLGLKKLENKKLMEVVVACCLPLFVGFEESVNKGKGGGRDDRSPKRHIGHGVLVKEGKSLPVDVNNSKVEKEFALCDSSILEQRDTGTLTYAF